MLDAVPHDEAERARRYRHLLAEERRGSGRRLAWIGGLLLFYLACVSVSGIDIPRLMEGLPRLFMWLARSWPPDLTDLDAVLRGAAETVAIATIGTTLGALLAVPLCLLAARNTSPAPFLYWPARALLNGLRSIDTFVFALLFVAAVGLGPFSGILGVAFHVTGSIAKLWSEQIEAADPRPIEALAATGASRLLVMRYGLLPTVLPSLASIVLYMWEFNIRSSTVLGLVGAGGIGQQLKNSVDLLDFPRLVTILAVILFMVAIADAASAQIRKRLIEE